jgi:hypothetical protein
LGIGFSALLFGSFDPHSPKATSDPFNPIDLALRYREVHRWFAGLPIYTSAWDDYLDATYPPASMIILYPLLAWGSFLLVRWLFALISLAILSWLSWLFLRGAGYNNGWMALLAALIPLSGNAVGTTIALGQLSLIAVAAALASILVLNRSSASGIGDLTAAIFATIALVKPSISAPFVLLLPVVGRRWRPVVMTVGLYALITVGACGFQKEDLLSLIKAWLANGMHWTGTEAAGYGSLSVWLNSVGLAGASFAAGIVLLIGLGVWLNSFQDRDQWLLLGVVAVVARIWTWHRGYDDVVTLVCLLSLLHLTTRKSVPMQFRRLGTVLLIFGIIANALPARLPVQSTLLPALWVANLIFFLAMARCQNCLKRLHPTEAFS